MKLKIETNEEKETIEFTFSDHQSKNLRVQLDYESLLRSLVGETFVLREGVLSKNYVTDLESIEVAQG